MSIADKLNTIAENEQLVYRAGQKLEYDKFWDRFQNNGNTRIYYYAFAYNRFNDTNYNPKYPINCSTPNTAAQQLFASSTSITDTKVPIVINGTNANAMFNGASNLVNIQEIEIKKANTTFNSTFTNCVALVDITFTGLQIDNNIDFSYCSKLSDKSVDNIIEHLKNFNGTSGKTLTVHTDVYNRMVSDGRKILVENKNWTLKK